MSLYDYWYSQYWQTVNSNVRGLRSALPAPSFPLLLAGLPAPLLLS